MAQDRHALDVLPTYEYRKVDEARGYDAAISSSASASSQNRPGDDKPPAATPSAKIKSLDGLRGIACFLVFNYHFLWPWTPLIMLGYGARPPKSPEPYTDWTQLPIICLLHRGRPMVAIFFAISGYVLCRHIQSAILTRRLDDAYQKLSSAVFRRIFRLYIPCTVSMFIVCVLAQFGAFKSEKAIYKGPDSAWINGTVTKGWYLPHGADSCPNSTIVVQGKEGIAEVLGLQTTLYLNDTIQKTDLLCLNITSTQHMPAILYSDIDKPKPKPNAARNGTMNATAMADSDMHVVASGNRPAHVAVAGRSPSLFSHDTVVPKADGSLVPFPALTSARNSDNRTGTRQKPFTWVQLGGSWEEHPIHHPHFPKALANFTVVYGQWANPFNFGHMHPRYDPHTWTIPKELRGSMVLYTFLLGTAVIKARWRLSAAVGLAAYAITFGYWDMGVFVGGMVYSEVDLLRTAGALDMSALSVSDRAFALAMRGSGLGVSSLLSLRSHRALRWTAIFAALYLLSYPDAGAEFTPGFRTLAWLAPRWYTPVSKWMFFQALGALLLIPAVLRSPTLRGLLESGPAQYMGRISFSFYLVHGPVLHCFGFWVMPRLFERVGKVGGYILGWVWLAAMALYLSGWFYKKVDVWSVGVGRRVERVVVNA
ncbi:acyltransferase 3 [Coniella lustricola]|uniref:Acyltransferase 3 n=1 Tax=Coniella lustricola TaxID=2025994 RepID=A0A2T2ZWU7_9PEZI|nr:acyltransferase 3 [Coniella lustricola]